MEGEGVRIDGTDVWMVAKIHPDGSAEPRRVCRRLFGVSHAARVEPIAAHREPCSPPRRRPATSRTARSRTSGA